MMEKNDVRVGGIINHQPGYGFKLTFKTIRQARYYKDMFMIILRSDDFVVKDLNGYHDKEE